MNKLENVRKYLMMVVGMWMMLLTKQIDRRSSWPLISLDPVSGPGGSRSAGRPGGPDAPLAVYGAGSQVTWKHLQGSSITCQGIRVGQQKFESITTAPG